MNSWIVKSKCGNSAIPIQTFTSLKATTHRIKKNDKSVILNELIAQSQCALGPGCVNAVDTLDAR